MITSSDVQSLTVDINLISPNPDQPRKLFDPVALQELADSIKEVGLLSPIAVRSNGDGYIIVHGERRWRACRLAELPTIRVEIREADDDDAYTMSVIENEQRENLAPIETAKSLQQMMTSQNITQGEVARRIGKTRTWVTQKLRLLSLPEETQALMDEGLTEGHARQLLKLQTAEMGGKVNDLAAQAAKEEWSVNRLQIEVDMVINHPDSPEKVSRDTLQVMVIGDGKRLVLTGDKARAVIEYAQSLLFNVSQDTKGGEQ